MAKCRLWTSIPGASCPTARGSAGIHQLIEAKEYCAITERRQTLAQIVYQRFFRRYLHLCGMTGTAIEPAGERRAVMAYGSCVYPQIGRCAERILARVCLQRPISNGISSSNP